MRTPPTVATCTCDHPLKGHSVGCPVCRAEGRADWQHRYERKPRNAHISTADIYARVRSCTVKTHRYPTQGAADRAAVAMERKHPGQAFDGYPCRWDVEGNRHFHVGHTPTSRHRGGFTRPLPSSYC